MSDEPLKPNSQMKNEALISDLRRAPRHDSVNLLWYESCEGSDGPPVRGIGNTVNISTGGIAIRTARPLRRGQKLSVEVFTKLERKIKAVCEVTHVSPSGEQFHLNGLRFVAISADDLEYLREKFPEVSPAE